MSKCANFAKNVQMPSITCFDCNYDFYSSFFFQNCVEFDLIQNHPKASKMS